MFHWVDYAIISVIALSAITGLIRGFIKEIVALGVWVIAGWMAFVYAKPVANWLATYVQDNSARVILAYVVIIVGTLIIGGLLNTMLSFIMHHSGLTGTDRLLGVGFGTVRGIFVVALVLVVVRLSAFPEEDYRKHSLLYHYFTPVVDKLYQYVPNVLKRVEDLEHKTKPTREKHPEITVRDFQSL